MDKPSVWLLEYGLSYERDVNTRFHFSFINEDVEVFQFVSL